MPSDAEQVATIKSQALARLAEITAVQKPTYNVDGQLVNWTPEKTELRETVAWCDKQLAAESPVEIHSIAFNP